jgi:hypothetical protein
MQNVRDIDRHRRRGSWIEGVVLEGHPKGFIDRTRLMVFVEGM